MYLYSILKTASTRCLLVVLDLNTARGVTGVIVAGLETDVLAESGPMHSDPSISSVAQLFLRSAGAALGFLGMEEVVKFLGN